MSKIVTEPDLFSLITNSITCFFAPLTDKWIGVASVAQSCDHHRHTAWTPPDDLARKVPGDAAMHHVINGMTGPKGTVEGAEAGAGARKGTDGATRGTETEKTR